MLTKIKAQKLALIVVALLITTFGIIASVTVRSQQQGEEPTTKEPDEPPTNQIISSSRDSKVPPLTVAGKDAEETVSEFIKFAGDSGFDQREEIRRTLAAASDNKEAVNLLCDEAFKGEKEDHSKALLALSLLGEMRSLHSAQCLNRFLNLPFPETGTVVDGEIIEQTALGTLQAKAVDGLAYLNTKETNKFVLNAVKNHPSIIVRAEAIEAYLWNQRNTLAEGHRTLNQYVRKGEEIYLDRVRRETRENATSFDRKLETFLKAHPEANVPIPEVEIETQNQKDERPARIPNPPKF